MEFSEQMRKQKNKKLAMQKISTVKLIKQQLINGYNPTHTYIIYR